MNGKNLLSGLSYINWKFVEESEIASSKELSKTKRFIRKPLLIAAIIALMVLLMGCAVVLRMPSLEVGERDITRGVFDEYHREIVGTEPVSQKVLTLSGLKDSPTYLAAKEWYEFIKSYDPDRTIREQAFQSDPEALFPDTYLAYSTYSQEMVDKLEEVAEKYNLKLLGAPLEFQAMGGFTHAVGVDHVLVAGSEVSAYLSGGKCYPAGNFSISMDLNMPNGEGMWPYSIHAQLHYCRNDCLSTEYQYLDLNQEWKDWNYVTASGATVLIIRAPEGEAYLFCDNGDSTLTIQFEAGYNPLTDIPEFVPEWMTDRQVEQVADAIDFTIRPQLPDQSASVVTSHDPGWEIETKQVLFDGSFGKVVFHLTAPEGTVLPCDDGEYVYPDNRDSDVLIPEAGTFEKDFLTVYSEDDGDGLTNTADLVYFFGVKTIDDPAFPLDGKWIAHIEDLTTQNWDGQKIVREVIAQGVWEPEVSFAGSDLRTIECLTEPITVSSSEGSVKITSFQLRTLGAVITLAEGSDIPHFLNPTAVMKDGTEIPMGIGDGQGRTIRKAADTPINLDQVSLVRLPFGTELPVNIA